MKVVYLFFVSIFFLLYSCEAPRENPFDPQSDNYFEQKPDLVITTVYVKQLYPPFNPITNAQVIEPSLHLFGTTNNQGIVQFEHPTVDSLTFYVWADSYFSDTLQFKTKQSNEYEIFLNAKPVINQVIFKSFYNNVYEGFSSTSLHFEALISDLDGPIDIDHRVHLKNAAYQFDTLLVRDINTSNLFSIEFDLRDISSDLVPEQVPELNFTLIVKNINGAKVSSGPYAIRRVIKTTLKQLSPMISQVTQDSVIFKWVDPELPYDYTFNIVLLKLPSFEEIKYKGIPKGQTTFIAKNLTPGQYNWKLQVEDRLGNICQSNYINFYHEQ